MNKWREIQRYRFDNIISRGTGAMVAALAVVSLAVVVLVGAVVAITGVHPIGEEPIGFIEGTWLALMRTLDPGTMGGDTGWGFRLVMFAATTGGILVISSLIGILANGIQNKIEELRRGRSQVLEEGHTVILGWTDQVYTIVSELVEANTNQARSCIVIMGEMDKVQMEEQIRQRIGKPGRTRIVCRTGTHLELTDLQMVSLNSTKSIIILSPEVEDPDSEVIKTVLAIINSPGRRKEPFHIVAELRDSKNLEAAKVVGKQEVEWVVVNDFVARIIAQTCHQSGLSVIYSDLLDFAGDEMYFFSHPALVGKTFKQCLFGFEHNAVLGICDKSGVCHLNAPVETVLAEGDQLIVIAEDDDRIFLNDDTTAVTDETLLSCSETAPDAPERLLILGWNSLGPEIVTELACYIPAGSQISIVSASSGDEHLLPGTEMQQDGSRLMISHAHGDTTDRRTLDELELGMYDHVVVLCYDSQGSSQKADAQTLITLLHLRDIADKHGYGYTIVSQMMDVRNRSLAALTRADDFIVSTQLISLMMTQVSESKQLNHVFRDLFNAEGSEIYLKPVETYIVCGQPVSFYTILEAAARRNETAIGYRLHSQAKDEALNYGIYLNPCKSQRVIYQPGDRVIVLARD